MLVPVLKHASLQKVKLYAAEMSPLTLHVLADLGSCYLLQLPPFLEGQKW